MRRRTYYLRAELTTSGAGILPRAGLLPKAGLLPRASLLPSGGASTLGAGELPRTGLHLGWAYHPGRAFYLMGGLTAPEGILPQSRRTTPDRPTLRAGLPPRASLLPYGRAYSPRRAFYLRAGELHLAKLLPQLGLLP